MSQNATTQPSQHASEMNAGQRFEFGANWTRFLRLLDDSRVEMAQQSLMNMLGVERLDGRRFLDIGSGSGLFSLAAHRLGASVHSFDYDPQSVACTVELRRRHAREGRTWEVDAGSVLDANYVRGLGTFDVVYSWGVLHHTGWMAQSFAHAAAAVADSGLLFIAIYNDQAWVSRYWACIKRLYNRNVMLRWLVIALHWPYLVGARWVIRKLTHRQALPRGMSLWYDMLDWLGGYPFEVAKPEAVFEYFQQRNFVLQRLKTCGGRMGCNEFVFRRNAPTDPRAGELPKS